MALLVDEELRLYTTADETSFTHGSDLLVLLGLGQLFYVNLGVFFESGLFDKVLKVKIPQVVIDLLLTILLVQVVAILSVSHLIELHLFPLLLEARQLLGGLVAQ